jgi:hypothetical protein
MKMRRKKRSEIDGDVEIKNEDEHSEKRRKKPWMKKTWT